MVCVSGANWAAGTVRVGQRAAYVAGGVSEVVEEVAVCSVVGEEEEEGWVGNDAASDLSCMPDCDPKPVCS